MPKKTNIFLDEAGDLTFFGKGRLPIVGVQGVSNYFILGIAVFEDNLDTIRNQILSLQKQIAGDEWYKDIRSVNRKLNDKGFFFHATDDLPETRKLLYDWIKTAPVNFEAVIANKDPARFVHKHNGKELEMYTDLLSHLLRDKVHSEKQYSLCVAQIGNSLKMGHLQAAIQKAIRLKMHDSTDITAKESGVGYFFNNQIGEPILNVADYFCWALQRVVEKKECRYYNFIKAKIKNLTLLWDSETWEQKIINCNEYK